MHILGKLLDNKWMDIFPVKRLILFSFEEIKREYEFALERSGRQDRCHLKEEEKKKIII